MRGQYGYVLYELNKLERETGVKVNKAVYWTPVLVAGAIFLIVMLGVIATHQ